MTPPEDPPPGPRMVSPGARRARARLAGATTSGARLQRRRYRYVGVFLAALAVVTTVTTVRDRAPWGLLALVPQALGLVALQRASAHLQPTFAEGTARGYLREGAWLVTAVALSGLGLWIVSRAG